MRPNRWTGSRMSVVALIVTSCTVITAVAAWRDAQATPAYARRFGVECATCHSPNPARLNNVGMVFRRAGFRLPDADESGNLTLKAMPAHTIGEALAIAGQADYNLTQSGSPGTSKSSAQLSEVELIAGTSIGEKYSAQALLIPYNDEGSFNLENFEFQMNSGKPADQWIVRMGLAQPLLWQKGGHGSMTQSAPLILDEGAASPIGSFAGPGLGTMLPLAEVGFMHTKLEKGKLMSTWVSLAATNGYQGDGASARVHAGDGTDVLVQATQLMGSRNTANAFYYNGHTAYDTEDPAVVGTSRDRFDRYGVTASFAPMDPLDLVAGYVGGQDKSDELGLTLKTSGYYAELTGTIMPHWIACYRYDSVDPDTKTSKDSITANTLGTTYLLDDAVFLSAEWQEREQNSVKSHGVLARIRILY
jgi:hypothetical protein